MVRHLPCMGDWQYAGTKCKRGTLCCIWGGGAPALHILLLTLHDSLKLRLWEELFLWKHIAWIFSNHRPSSLKGACCVYILILHCFYVYTSLPTECSTPAALEIESLGKDVRSRSNRLAVAQQWVSEAHKDPGIDSEWGAAVYRSPAVKTLLLTTTAKDAASVEGSFYLSYYTFCIIIVGGFREISYIVIS